MGLDNYTRSIFGWKIEGRENVHKFQTKLEKENEYLKHQIEVVKSIYKQEINLKCSCFCSGACKHEFAAMLQLKESLELITENYEDEYKKGFFRRLFKC